MGQRVRTHCFNRLGPARRDVLFGVTRPFTMEWWRRTAPLVNRPDDHTLARTAPTSLLGWNPHDSPPRDRPDGVRLFPRLRRRYARQSRDREEDSRRAGP